MLLSPLIECPHCNTTILVEALNCRILTCDRLYNDGLNYGCGKPFRVDMSGCLVDIFKRKNKHKEKSHCNM